MSGRPQPTDQQVATFDEAVAMTAVAPANHHASVKGEMDEDGTMVVSLTEDGVTRHARFGADGSLVGDWF